MAISKLYDSEAEESEQCTVRNKLQHQILGTHLKSEGITKGRKGLKWKSSMCVLPIVHVVMNAGFFKCF